MGEYSRRDQDERARGKLYDETELRKNEMAALSVIVASKCLHSAEAIGKIHAVVMCKGGDLRAEVESARRKYAPSEISFEVRHMFGKLGHV